LDPQIDIQKYHAPFKTQGVTVKQSGTIIVGDKFEDIRDELVMQGCYHLRVGTPQGGTDVGATSSQEDQSLICPKCQIVAEGAGHPDPCLGKLPGVRFACCGHGKDYGYIVFENGTVVISKTGFEVETWHKP
jgi:hypothetical protein